MNKTINEFVLVLQFLLKMLRHLGRVRLGGGGGGQGEAPDDKGHNLLHLTIPNWRLFTVEIIASM